MSDDDDWSDDDHVISVDNPDTGLALIPKDLIEDASLSLEARFLMIWVIAFPEAGVSGEVLGISDEAYASALDELHERGLVSSVSGGH